MRYLIAAMLLSFPILATADSPPDWPEYRVCGEAKWFCADIQRTEESMLDVAWEADYKLRMLDMRTTLPRVRWEHEYKHPGYGGGFVTTDGSYFVYVDQWYRHEGAAVAIYSADELRTIPGKEFHLQKKHLKETASHHLWLEWEGVPSAARLDGHELILKLLDGRERVVNLEDGTIRIALPDPDKESIWKQR